MNPIIMNGVKVAEMLQRQVANKISLLRNQSQLLSDSSLQAPKIAFILAGKSAASESYVKKKIKVSNQIGIETILYRFPEDAKLNDIKQRIQILNQDSSVDGILVQLPLPNQLNRLDIIHEINYKKDVDCLHSANLQHLILRGELQETLPCTPAGVMQLLDYYKINVRGMNATIIGRSHLVGYPLSILLMLRNATVTICHKQTKCLEEHIQKADLVVSATGVRHLVKGEWIKKGAIVIDVGINQGLKEDKTKIVGDVDFNNALPRCSFITPVPGGVGPMTIARLMVNLSNLWCLKHNFPIEIAKLPDDYLKD